MDIAIVGGGLCGLSLALNLQRRRLECRLYECAPVIKKLGVGVTLLPHAMREFAALGGTGRMVGSRHRKLGKLLLRSVRTVIYKEARGKLAGYITQDELRALSENYKPIAGFSLDDVAGEPS